jgi:hypothetical protein
MALSFTANLQTAMKTDHGTPRNIIQLCKKTVK